MVSQAEVLSIFSRPDKEIRCEVADHVIPQGPLMDPERLQVTSKESASVSESIRFLRHALYWPTIEVSRAAAGRSD